MEVYGHNSLDPDPDMKTGDQVKGFRRDIKI